ncbi:MAG: class A beta-lactamase-related serine hydrolase [Bacteroidia bacterium]|nr:class A beta-lactamase-related serine hydrolase [Bacteroidia bacterium]
MLKRYMLFCLFGAYCLHLQAQIDQADPLFLELKDQDSIFFERGFNLCDFDYLEKHIDQHLTFYHDQVGVQDRDGFFESTRNNICGNSDLKPIRKLEKGSLEVFPLYTNGKLYGAIQKGIHHFYLREKNKADVWTSTARFTTVWTKSGTNWQVSEVLSYDHQDQKENIPTHKVSEIDIETLLEENHVPALGIGIITHGKLTQVNLHGTLDGQATAPYNSLFKVASLTKPIFAITVLKLIENNLLELDEPLYKYWIDPDIKKDKRYKKLTPRLVLTHQTGFPNWRYLTEENKLSFQFDPGSKYQYSGEGFEYLRKAIEQKLGKPIEEIARELLFEPAGMNDTYFWWDDAIDESRYAQNFDAGGNKIPLNKYYEANAAANLLSTVEDYGKFLTYVLNGAGLSDDLYAEMLKHQLELAPDDYFGLGWQILTNFSNEEFAMLHSGKDPGVSTLAVIFPKSKNGFVIFMNGDNILPIYEKLLKNKLYLGDELWDKQ